MRTHSFCFRSTFRQFFQLRLYEKRHSVKTNDWIKLKIIVCIFLRITHQKPKFQEFLLKFLEVSSLKNSISLQWVEVGGRKLWDRLFRLRTTRSWNFSRIRSGQQAVYFGLVVKILNNRSVMLKKYKWKDQRKNRKVKKQHDSTRIWKLQGMKSK